MTRTVHSAQRAIDHHETSGDAYLPANDPWMLFEQSQVDFEDSQPFFDADTMWAAIEETGKRLPLLVAHAARKEAADALDGMPCPYCGTIFEYI